MPWKKMLVASVLPVVFQWSFGGFPVVFQCVPIMQINTGTPLGHHWYPSVLTESGLESLGQVTSQHATPYVYNWYGESCLN